MFKCVKQENNSSITDLGYKMLKQCNSFTVIKDVNQTYDLRGESLSTTAGKIKFCSKSSVDHQHIISKPRIKNNKFRFFTTIIFKFIQHNIKFSNFSGNQIICEEMAICTGIKPNKN